jgi:signal transduction histidine kinase
MLDTARRALERDNPERATELIEDARHLTERNISALRDEIVGLGPYAFRELSFETAVEECVPVWRRRFGLDVRLDIEQLTLSPEVSGPLFQIAQEAVTNAGRHAAASSVRVSLQQRDGAVELRVEDDGRGFGELAPAMSESSGHIGLASMRERAELIAGKLSIESSRRGTVVKVQVPLSGAAPAA